MGLDPACDANDAGLLCLLVERSLEPREEVSIFGLGDERADPRSLLGSLDIDAPAAVLREAGRFASSSWLARSGLVEAVGPKDVRILDREFRATPRLLAMATEGLSADVLAGRSRRRSRFKTAATEGDLVLAPDVEARFERVVRFSQHVGRFAGTAAAGNLPSGKGMAALFHGPPGCGKTQAARVLARRLGKPLLLVSCSDVLDCWVGSTEKNVEKAFAEAEREGAVLAFDEADSLLYARSTTERSWERQIVSAFLVRLESFEGVSVFTTNDAEHLDPAFERRFAFRIEFPRPGSRERERIWAAFLSSIASPPPAEPADLATFDLTGAEIRSAFVAACVEATSRGDAAPTRADLLAGVEAASEGRWTRASDDGPGFRVGGSGPKA